jgi:alanyl-tRNA synthetase
MHSALQQVLGKHVAQKGSLVNEQQTRFDFSHFAKVTNEELAQIENIVNDKVRENILLDEKRNVPIQEAIDAGATALFGEKYGDFVRVITFDKNYSVELCGGTHVKATGEIGLFKIVAETSVAAGVRRVEAITANNALNYFKQQEQQLAEINALLNHPKDVSKGIEALLKENETLKKAVEEINLQKAQTIKEELLSKVANINGINVIIERANLNADLLKNISFEIKQQVENLFMLLASEADDKPFLSLIISENLVKEKNMNASTIIRELAKDIQGGGGGQSFYATAGGKNKEGLNSAMTKAKSFIQ